MPYNLLTNFIFLASVLGITVLVLRRLPQALQQGEEVTQAEPAPNELLAEKGLPAKAASKTKALLKVFGHKVWQFVLEAKGLKHAPKIKYNFKKIAGQEAQPEVKPPIARGEQYYIELIKRHPKDLGNYDQLGGFYIEARKYEDAANVYDYLCAHDPANGAYFAKLGLSRLYMQEHKLAAEAYEKAVELDPSHPSRFYNLALSLQGQRKWKKAVLALRKALELDTENQKYLDLLFELESKAKISPPVENITEKE